MSTTTPITLITGGSRGLGRNAALALAADGSDIVLTYRSQADEAAAVVAEIHTLGRRAQALPLDVADAESFAAFAAQLKQVLAGWDRTQFDALVNNAGTGLHAAIADTTPAQFDALVNIHLKGPYFLTQALLPLIADGGRILNVSSGLARFALPGASAYAMMKGGVEVFTRYLAKELGARGIRANTLAPGAIETDFNGGSVRDNAQVNAMVSSVTALGRPGLPDDIGPVVAALLAPGTGWINAQRIEVSGGMLI
ncbi:short-chain dehydrogenase [Xanthomonas arboricola]|uniref:SDR family NAD(P)-dependent oxidoreductase n=1 Tax=Xanthomonas arboricola TaxID=56448 RepID=UPI0004D3A67C|nr:SDR family oxidoreductase [Xanthomonas arboricola]KER87357.1 short-chain dehydrogenase [Xanthomonas arboricola pv. celebensis]MBB6256713.1 NAD(P)-dependent dehydrogenase (short-subunit alcohol dehydrogenase family) [Xanthomonas arboricola]MBB6574753.1 NAD(P)-dependent dehydrogenase (short-subunit alcohol dehydrogenase family) [Xanthomonas arboricola]NIJ85708.1 NAD(P)-dependent dehydrogenase (short-subunit alcohol dehydrogenase family) [Xanthomonas arboricola]NIK53862.1 NAD(P)-dependent dehy